jgi:hypothetical protein
MAQAAVIELRPTVTSVNRKTRMEKPYQAK